MKFTIWKDAKGEWRWTLKARNGRVIADGSESYKRRAAAMAMIKKINAALPVEDADGHA